MKIRALVTVQTKDGLFSPGQELELDPKEAARLISRNFAEAIEQPAEQKPAEPASKPAAPAKNAAPAKAAAPATSK